MPQFFIASRDMRDGRCIVAGDDFHHLVRVRRVCEGDEIKLRCEDGKLMTGKVVAIGDDSLTAEIIDKKSPGAVSLNLTLCLALLKGKKFDFAIQKAVEVGVSGIIPVMTERTIPDIENKEQRRLERWNRIAEEAAKQCMMPGIPAVEAPRPFYELVAGISGGIKMIAHPDGSVRNLDGCLREGDGNSRLYLLVGPEGGFSDAEVASARSGGWIDFGFGFTQLRAETAAIVLPAIMMYEWSCMHENNRQ